MITKPFTETEVRRIEKELSRRTDKLRDLALFRMSVDTMLRTSDLRGLRVCDVQEATGEIRKRIEVKMKKTGRMVSCVLDEKTKSALTNWIEFSSKANSESPIETLLLKVSSDEVGEITSLPSHNALNNLLYFQKIIFSLQDCQGASSI